MFFSRSGRGCRGWGKLKYQKPGPSQVVLYKIAHAAQAVALALFFPVLFRYAGVLVPVVVLVIRMGGPPLLLAVADTLRVLGIGLHLVPVIIGAAAPPAVGWPQTA